VIVFSVSYEISKVIGWYSTLRFVRECEAIDGVGGGGGDVRGLACRNELYK